MPRIRLTFSEGPRTGESLEVDIPLPGGPPITFGRSRESTVSIDSPHLSRRHAEIFADQFGRLMIRDAGSVNGTIVNERMVTAAEAIPLNPGDFVRVGDTLFSFDGFFDAATPGLNYGPLATQVSASNERPTAPASNPPFHRAIPGPTVPLSPDQSNPASPLTDASYIYLILRNGQRYLFKGEEATVGRGQGNDIVIDSNSISRQHAKLQRTPNGIYVSDLGSTNKTFVNGVMADVPTLLHNGDVVRFGDIEADFRVEEERQSGLFNIGDQTMVEGLPDHTMRDFTNLSIDINEIHQGPGLEQLETALDIDIRGFQVVGRRGRHTSEALPESRFPDLRPNAASAETFIGQVEIARLEGVFVTEGIGRAAQVILRDVRLGLRQGELVAVVGPSGSGKSELVQIMAGLLPADKGRITVLGRDIPTYESAGRRLSFEADREFVRWRAKNIGYLNSGFQLDPKRPAFEHVMQPMEIAGVGRDLRERQERAFERLQLVGISDPEVTRLRPNDLTRTEKQLVMIARGIATDPPLLLCDEPLGNLTSDAANNVFNLLKRLVSSGKTVLMATQDHFWANNASRIIEILDGAIVGSLS